MPRPMPRRRVTRRARLRAPVVVPVIVLVLTGCTVTDGSGPEGAGTGTAVPADVPAAPPATGPSEPDGAPTPDPELDEPSDPAPRPAPAPDPDPPGACDDATRAGMAATLTAQLDALAEEDFAAAYAVTSAFFRNFFTQDGFETLIRDEYPTLVGNVGHRFAECGVVGRRGFLVVGVRGADADELVLRYDLSDEAEGWRIDGALALPAVTLPPDPLV